MSSCKAGGWMQRSWWCRYTLNGECGTWVLDAVQMWAVWKIKAVNGMSFKNERMHLFLGAGPCSLISFCQGDPVWSSGCHALSSASGLQAGSHWCAWWASLCRDLAEPHPPTEQREWNARTLLFKHVTKEKSRNLLSRCLIVSPLHFPWFKPQSLLTPLLFSVLYTCRCRNPCAWCYFWTERPLPFFLQALMIQMLHKCWGRETRITQITWLCHPFAAVAVAYNVVKGSAGQVWWHDSFHTNSARASDLNRCVLCLGWLRDSGAVSATNVEWRR